MKEILNMNTNLMKNTGLGAALALALLLTAGSAAAATMPKIKTDSRPLDREAKGASYAPVVKKVAPSVVNIYSTRTIRVPRYQFPFWDDPFFRRFFGGDDDRRPRWPRFDTEKTRSLGSGVIVSEDGYILTNNHVVDGADSDGVKVALADGKKEYTAKIVGKDPQTDVAVLKIEASGLPAITLADSDKLEVGDVVLAIGNPFGVGQAVSQGIISGIGRGGFGIVDYEDFIQTDAAINPGNSGGALVDTEGRLVGVNTFIVSRSGGSQGVGFAIPINLARSVMERLINYGKVSRGYLGVNIQPVTPDLAKEFNLPDESGALVGEVMPNTPAEDAGIKEGDVIIEFNGKKVEDFRHLRLMVAQTPPKTKVTLKVIRDGRERTLSATLGELPGDLARGGRPGDESEEPGEGALEGVQMADLDSATRRQYDIPASVRGALVAQVDRMSNAYEAGLREGDVILEINRKPVADADDAIRLAGQAKGDRILLRVWSKNGSRYVVISKGAPKK